MATLKIEIDIDNDAFHGDCEEVKRILSLIGELAMECEGDHPVTKVRDSNGNTVGRWGIND